MFINSYFPTVVWSEEKPEFVKSLNKASNKFIADARKREKEFEGCINNLNERKELCKQLVEKKPSLFSIIKNVHK